MSRARLRRIGGNLFIAPIVIFAGRFLVAGLTGVGLGLHDDGGVYGCIGFLVSGALVCVSILCWVVSLFQPKELDELR